MRLTKWTCSFQIRRGGRRRRGGKNGLEAFAAVEDVTAREESDGLNILTTLMAMKVRLACAERKGPPSSHVRTRRRKTRRRGRRREGMLRMEGFEKLTLLVCKLSEKKSKKFFVLERKYVTS